MALIKCPECGKEISDKAPACIHCGYPLTDIYKVPELELYDVIYDGFKSDKIRYENGTGLIGCLRQLKSLSLAEAKKAVDNPPFVIMSGIQKEKAEWAIATIKPFKCELRVVKSLGKKEENDDMLVGSYLSSGGSSLICPHCGSNQVTTEAKGYSLIMGFIGSGKPINKCGKCGWTWNPKR